MSTALYTLSIPIRLSAQIWVPTRSLISVRLHDLGKILILLQDSCFMETQPVINEWMGEDWIDSTFDNTFLQFPAHYHMLQFVKFEHIDKIKIAKYAFLRLWFVMWCDGLICFKGGFAKRSFCNLVVAILLFLWCWASFQILTWDTLVVLSQHHSKVWKSKLTLCRNVWAALLRPLEGGESIPQNSADQLLS